MEVTKIDRKMPNADAAKSAGAVCREDGDIFLSAASLARQHTLSGFVAAHIWGWLLEVSQILRHHHCQEE